MVKKSCTSYFQTKIFIGLKDIKTLNDSTLLLITPNAKKEKQKFLMLSLATQKNVKKAYADFSFCWINCSKLIFSGTEL